jgi:hypothetical protein
VCRHLRRVAERLAYHGADIIAPYTTMMHTSVPASLWASEKFRDAVKRGHAARQLRRDTVIAALPTNNQGAQCIPQPVAMMIADYVLPPVLMTVDQVLAAMGAPWDGNWMLLLEKAWQYFYAFDDTAFVKVLTAVSLKCTLVTSPNSAGGVYVISNA